MVFSLWLGVGFPFIAKQPRTFLLCFSVCGFSLTYITFDKTQHREFIASHHTRSYAIKKRFRFCVRNIVHYLFILFTL